MFCLDKEMTISKTIQLLKGESSFRANKVKLTKFHFEWGDEYYAVSVSPSQLKKVNAYIDNQKDHHRKKRLRKSTMNF